MCPIDYKPREMSIKNFTVLKDLATRVKVEVATIEAVNLKIKILENINLNS